MNDVILSRLRIPAVMVCLAVGTACAGGGDFTDLTLRIATPKAESLPLEPLPITISLSNNTAAAIEGHTPVSPGAGFLDIYVASGDQDFEKFPTADWSCASELLSARPLKPGVVKRVSGYLYYAHAPDPQKEKGRYLFPSPGAYRIMAKLKNARGDKEIKSNVLTVVAKQPAGQDAAAYEFLRALQDRTDKDAKGQTFRYSSFLMATPLARSSQGAKVLRRQEEMLSRFPDSRYCLYLCYSLGVVYSSRLGNNPQRGILLLEKAGSFEGFFLADKALGLLVELSVKQGNLKKAKEYLAVLKAKFPDSPWVNVAGSQIGKASSG